MATSKLVKVQKMGAFLSASVMLNIGVFIGWGILAALFIPKGWIPNETLGGMVAPTIKYLIPLLIGYTGGYNIYGQRGGVIGAFATMGLILGANINMLAGAMFMGPFAAWCLRKVDKLFEGKVMPGMEMLISNFSLGIVGVSLMVFGYFTVVPVIELLIGILAGGVSFLIERSILPLLAIFVQPGKVLFLNNAINHGIMEPLAIEQAAQAGKSLLFMIEANNGCVFGTAMAFAIFGKGTAKKAAPGAAIINFFGGIGEVVYPFVLSRPIVLLGQIAGSMTSLFIIQEFGGGTVAPISPGSFFALLAVSPKDSIIVNVISYLAGAVVALLVAGFCLKITNGKEEDIEVAAEAKAHSTRPGNVNAQINAVIDCPMVRRVVFACDAGMGSSVMGESIMKTKLAKAMLQIDVVHCAVAKIKENIKQGDLIITSKPLAARVKDELEADALGIPVFPVDNLLNAKAYDEIIAAIKQQ